jgi:hypothetical protein
MKERDGVLGTKVQETVNDFMSRYRIIHLNHTRTIITSIAVEEKSPPDVEARRRDFPSASRHSISIHSQADWTGSETNAKLLSSFFLQNKHARLSNKT